MSRFLLVISGYIIAEAAFVVLAVIFIDIIWLRVILMAIIPIIFLIAAIRSDND